MRLITIRLSLILIKWGGEKFLIDKLVITIKFMKNQSVLRKYQASMKYNPGMFSTCAKQSGGDNPRGPYPKPFRAYLTLTKLRYTTFGFVGCCNPEKDC